MSGGVRILFPSADGKIRKSTVLSRDVEWAPTEYAFSRTRKNLQNVVKYFPEFCSANPIGVDQAQCDACDKCRVRFLKFDSSRLDGKTFFCTDIGVSCSEPEDKRVWSEFDPESISKLVSEQNEQDFEFTLDEDVPCVEQDGEISANRACISTEELAVARRTKIEIDKLVEICNEPTAKKPQSDSESARGSEEPLNENDYESAMLRLGIKEIPETELRQLQHRIKQEIRASKTERVTAKVIIVSNTEALAPDNVERDKWLEALGSEVQSLVNEFKVLRVAGISEVASGDQVLPSTLIFSRKPCGGLKAQIVAAGSFESVDPGNAYASVIGRDSWANMILLNAQQGNACYQVDVKNAFLQTEEGTNKGQASTFVRPPKQCNLNARVLWRVVGSLYGLKSAPRAWKESLVNS